MIVVIIVGFFFFTTEGFISFKKNSNESDLRYLKQFYRKEGLRISLL